MTPPIEDSIRKIGPGHWLLGSFVTCEIVPSTPADALISWQDEEGQTFCLRRMTSVESLYEARESASGEGRVHQAGTSAAVWKFGGAFFKVKAWRQGMQLEGDTIRHVNNISTIPTPKVVYSWVDSEWNRSFLVLTAVEGETLRQAWPTLSLDQRRNVADIVAQFCKDLALSTSERLETVDKKGIVEPFLSVRPPDSEPSWRPQLLGPFDSSDLQNYLCCSSLEILVPEGRLYLFHADLGPGNIMLKDGRITGILDWESAAYYPRYWLATKPLVSPGFYLEGFKAQKREWADLLVQSLKLLGFPSDIRAYELWKSAIEMLN